MLCDKSDGSRVVGFTCDVTRRDVQKLLISVKNAFQTILLASLVQTLASYSLARLY